MTQLTAEMMKMGEAMTRLPSRGEEYKALSRSYQGKNDLLKDLMEVRVISSQHRVDSFLDSMLTQCVQVMVPAVDRSK